jgi:hypothetical protein
VIADFLPTGTPSGDGSAHATGSGTALASGSFTPGGSADLVVGFGGVSANGITWTAGSGFTLPAAMSFAGLGGSANAFALQYQAGVTGAINPAMTISPTNEWGLIGAAFQEAAPPAITGFQAPIARDRSQSRRKMWAE